MTRAESKQGINQDMGQVSNTQDVLSKHTQLKSGNKVVHMDDRIDECT